MQRSAGASRACGQVWGALDRGMGGGHWEAFQQLKTSVAGAQRATEWQWRGLRGEGLSPKSQWHSRHRILRATWKGRYSLGRLALPFVLYVFVCGMCMFDIYVCPEAQGKCWVTYTALHFIPLRQGLSVNPELSVFVPCRQAESPSIPPIFLPVPPSWGYWCMHAHPNFFCGSSC